MLSTEEKLWKCEPLLLSFPSQPPLVSLFKLDFLFNAQDFNHSPRGQESMKIAIKDAAF